MSEKSEALRLADALMEEHPFPRDIRLAAAELRRLAAVEAQRDALRAELKEATEAINDPAVNNLRTLPESIRVLCAQRDALQQTLHDELAGNLRLRDLGGARPDEPMLTFLERIIAERDALLEALRDLVQLEADGRTEYESAIPHWDAARAAIAAVEEGK